MSMATGAMAAAAKAKASAADNYQTMTTVGAGGQLLLSLGQAVSSLYQGKYEKRIAGANARLNDYRAEDAIRRGDVEANRHLAATRGLIGSQRAAAAAQGVDVGSGSAVDIQESTAGMGALDAQTIRDNAFREAWGYRMEALNQRNAGRYAARAGRFVAGQTLLGSALDAYGDVRAGRLKAAEMRKYGL